jgi:hypothetical protein
VVSSVLSLIVNVASLPDLVASDDSFESLESRVVDPRLRLYTEAQRWIEFVGEGSELSPLELVEEFIDEGTGGCAYQGSFPPRLDRDLQSSFE